MRDWTSFLPPTASSTGNDPAAVSLAVTDWYLYGVPHRPGLQPWPPGPDLVFTVSFSAAGSGTVAVNTGCSTGSGSVALQSNHTMIVSDLALTEGNCTAEQSTLEAAILDILARPLTWSIDFHQLTLTAVDDTAFFAQWRDTPNGDSSPDTQSLSTDAAPSS